MKKLLLITMLSVVSWVCNAQTSSETSSKIVPLPPAPTLPLSVSAIPIAQIRSFVAAADTFRKQAQVRIDALSRQIEAYQVRIAAGDTLTAYDTGQLKSLRGQLDNCRAALSEATSGYGVLKALLPRRYRAHVVDWDTLVAAWTNYERDLKTRGGRLLLVGTALGFIGAFLLFH